MANGIINATGRAPLSKVPGPVSVIIGPLNGAYKTHCKFLFALQKAHGRLAQIPSNRSKITVVAIYKKSDKGDVANYCPIVLLSHARKIIESARDSSIRNTYKFHNSQNVFQRGIGTDAVILRASDYQNKDHEYSAIPDFKEACDRAPRVKHVSSLRERLMKEIVRQILPFFTVRQID